MNSQFALPGIKSLAYVFSDNLNNNIAMQAVAKMPIMIFAQLTPLPFTGECTCVAENTNENNGTAETATLTFQSQVELPENHPVAFVITDVMDRTYILGAKEAPFPQIGVSRGFGLPDAEPSAISYEVKYQSMKALVACSIA